MFGLPDLFFGVIGLFIGSFLNVCIYRLPRNESLAFPPSHCTDCGTRLTAGDLVPVLSYAALRGKCRQCLCRIRIRYPAVELLTGILFYYSAKFAPYQAAAIGGDISSEVMFLKNIVFLSALVVVFFIDAEHRIIPDAVDLPMILAGIVFAAMAGKGMLFDSLKAAATGFLGFWAIAWLGELLFKKEAMGGGDVKLAAAIGAFLGLQPMLVGLFLAFLIGTAVGVPVTLLRGGKMGAQIPFGPMMAAGAAVALFFTDPIVAWWLGQVEKIWS